MATLSRGITATLVLVVGLLVIAACAPVVGPEPAVKLVATPVAPPVVAKSSSEPRPEWKVEWNKVLAAAKVEGKVVAVMPPGDSWRRAIDGFGKAYPEITLEYLGGLTAQQTSRTLGERQAGLYLLDVLGGGAPTLYESYRPAGALAPLRPALILPDVLDNSKWFGGFNAGWLEKGGYENAYGYLGGLTISTYVNRKVASPTELSTYDALLDPKWKGRIATGDPRVDGTAQSIWADLYYHKGEEWFRKLLAQDIVVQAEERMVLDGLVRGEYAVGMGFRPVLFLEMRALGLTDHVEYLEPESPWGGRFASAAGSVAILDKAPHPNAAKVFVNWLLSREAQQAIAREVVTASRRLDVENPPELAPKPGVKYTNGHSEEYREKLQPAYGILREVLR